MNKEEPRGLINIDLIEEKTNKLLRYIKKHHKKRHHRKKK